MNTYAFNINGEVHHVRAVTIKSAWWKIFYGALNKSGSIDMYKIDLRRVENPRRERKGNKIFDELRHI